MIERMSLRLRLALGAIILAHLAIPLLGLLHGGFWLWPIDLGRPALLLIMTWLVWRGHTWARWVLIVLVALSTLAFISLATIAPRAGALIRVIAVLMIPLALWSMVKLTTKPAHAAQGSSANEPAA